MLEVWSGRDPLAELESYLADARLFDARGGVFADVGSLWQLDDINGSMGQVDDTFHIRSSVGVSLFVDTPLAPLRFNYAIPIQYEDYDVTERFRFSVQTRF